MLPFNDSFIYLEWSPESWMFDLRSQIGGLAITQVFLVGSHNAATYSVKRSSSFGNDAPGMLCKHNVMSLIVKFAARDISSAWAKCQSMTIREQLDAGVRYLDLRITPHSKDGGRLYMTHGQLSITLNDALNDVLDFLSDPRSANEILILDFQHLIQMEDQDSQCQFLEEIDLISAYCIPSNVPLTTPLSVLWSALPKQRIFLLVEMSGLQHPTARIRSESLMSIWVNKAHVKGTLHSLDNLLISDLKKGAVYGVPPKLYVTQAVCTTTRSRIISGLLGRPFSAASSLRDVAERSNSSYLEWFCMLNAHSRLSGEAVTVPIGMNTHGNILMIDYVQLGRCRVIGEPTELNAVGMCVYLNLLRVSRQVTTVNIW